MSSRARGVVAVVGRRGKQRLWDLAERWYPERRDDPLAGSGATARREALARARRPLRERRVARASGCERRPGADADDVPVAVRPVDPRPRPRGGAVRLPLPPRDVRPEGEAASTATTSCRSSRRPARRTGRARVRPQGRRAARQLACTGSRREAGSLEKPLRELARPSSALAASNSRRGG